MSTEPSLVRIAIAVRNLEKARGLFEAILGGALRPARSGRSEVVSSLVWAREDEGPAIELMQPLDGDSTLARFIRKRGEGIHHLTLRVEDLDEAVARVSEAGGRIVHSPSYYRTPEGGAPREAFVHPKDAHGVLFHLVEDS